MAVKYFRIMWTEFSRLQEYKLEFIGEYLRIPVQIALLYALWNIIFNLSGQSSLGGLEFGEFVFYIGLAAFVGNAFFSMDVSEKISDFIIRGNMVVILTKPVGFISFFFARGASDFVVKGMLAVALFGSAGAMLGWYAPTSVLTVLLFTLSFILGMVLQFFVMLSTALLGFFLYYTWGARALINRTLAYFFSGELIPLTLFPDWLGMIAAFLPFKYVLFVPLFIYMEKYTTTEALWMMVLQGVFIILCLGICLAMYSKGLKKVDVQGG